MLDFLIVLALALGVVLFTIGGIALGAHLYDRHPVIRKFMNIQAFITTGYREDVRENLPDDYLDQIPGWDRLDQK